jgi:hypothetical protein
MRQLAPGSGEGPHPVTMRNFRHLDRSESKRPIKRAGSGHSAYVLMGVRRRKGCIMAEHRCQAQPIVTQLGRRLACSPPLTLEKDVEIEHHVSFQHVIDGPGQLMCQYRQCLALAVFFLSAGQICLARRMAAEEQHRRFGEGPLEIGIADLRAGGAIPLPRRFLGAFDQAAIGHKILDPRETGDIMDLVEQDQTQNLANAGDGWE